MAWVKDPFVEHDRDARVATNRKSCPYCALHTPELGHPHQVLRLAGYLANAPTAAVHAFRVKIDPFSSNDRLEWA
jgi:hypothetical protein